MMFPLTQWRIIRTPPAHGAWNMALDEAILEAAGSEKVPATLRVYRWQPACLSLGIAQPFADVSLDALKNHSYDLVRRPTGGRAILHVDELTYSVAGPQSDPRLSAGVVESYRILSQALLYCLRILGIQAQALEKPTQFNNLLARTETEADQSGRNNDKNPVCFEVPSNYEITVQGKKLIGSAQSRRKEGVLQHGSLPLKGDLTRIIKVLAFSNPALQVEASERLLSRATTVESLLGYPLSWENVASAMEIAFKKALNLDLRPDEITPEELRKANELVEEKYSNPQWTFRI